MGGVNIRRSAGLAGRPGGDRVGLHSPARVGRPGRQCDAGNPDRPARRARHGRGLCLHAAVHDPPRSGDGAPAGDGPRHHGRGLSRPPGIRLASTDAHARPLRPGPCRRGRVLPRRPGRVAVRPAADGRFPHRAAAEPEGADPGGDQVRVLRRGVHAASMGGRGLDRRGRSRPERHGGPLALASGRGRAVRVPRVFPLRSARQGTGRCVVRPRDDAVVPGRVEPVLRGLRTGERPAASVASSPRLAGLGMGRAVRSDVDGWDRLRLRLLRHGGRGLREHHRLDAGRVLDPAGSGGGADGDDSRRAARLAERAPAAPRGRGDDHTRDRAVRARRRKEEARAGADHSADPRPRPHVAERQCGQLLRRPGKRRFSPARYGSRRGPPCLFVGEHNVQFAVPAGPLAHRH